MIAVVLGLADVTDLWNPKGVVQSLNTEAECYLLVVVQRDFVLRQQACHCIQPSGATLGTEYETWR